MLIKWNTTAERLRFRYMPTFANWLLWLSTFHARAQLKKRSIAILVDTTIYALSVTHETQWVSTGHSEQWKTPLGYAARVPVHAEDCTTDDYESVQYLPGIAYLARRGFLLLKTSTELQSEYLRQPVRRMRGAGLFDYSVFNDTHPTSVDRPANGTDILDLASAEKQRERLSQTNDPLFQKLVARLGPSNSQDAWHIRTAEVYDCFCFLTMDGPLLRAVAQQARLEPFKSLRTKILSPKELGKELGIVSVPPRFLSYNDASFFVRPDLSQPGSKRVKYRKGLGG